MNTITQSPHATAGFSFGPLAVFVTSSPVQEGDKAPATNSPEHQANLGHAIFSALSSGLRPLVAALITAEYRQSSGHLIRIARHVSSLRSLPSQLWFEHVGPGGILPRCFPGLFPRLISTGQYLPGEVTDSFKSTIKFQGRTIAVVTCRIGPKPAFSLSNLLRSLVIHDPKSVMEKGENHGKAFGVFKNDRRSSSVRNPSEADSAGWPLPVSGRAHPSRF